MFDPKGYTMEHMYTLIFGAHIVGAVFTGVVGIVSGAALMHNKSSQYVYLAILLGLMATFEVLTGTVLAILSPQVSALALCGEIALYLGGVAFVEALLFARMRGMSITFPTQVTLSPVLASVALFVLALSTGY